jgi:hypothetical protein
MALTRPKYSQIYDTDWKQSVELATTADVGNLVLANVQPNSIDGVTVQTNYRILVKDQDSGAQNGIYLVRNAGTGSNGWWTRSLDALTSDRVTAGLTVGVVSGSVNGGKEFRLATPDPITLGVTALTFINPFEAAQPGGANTYVQFNDTGSILGGSAGLTFNKYSNVLTVGGPVISGELFVRSTGGDEGGQLNLGPAITNNTLVGNVVIDVWQNRLRIFESGGTNRGGYYDIGNLSAGVGTNLIDATSIQSGTSSVKTYSSSNVAISVGGTANTVVFTSSNVIVSGSIIPGANITYDLGSPTRKFRSAYFSGNTVYIGSESISVAADGTWTFTSNGGNATMSSSSAMGNVYMDKTNGYMGFNDPTPDFVYDFLAPGGGEILHIEGGVGTQAFFGARNSSGLNYAAGADQNYAFSGTIDTTNDYALKTNNIVRANIQGSSGNVIFTQSITVAKDVLATTLGIQEIRGTASNITVRSNITLLGTNLIGAGQLVIGTENLGEEALFVTGGATYLDGDVTVTGNLFVNGNVTYINSNNVNISDSMIYLAEDNPADTLDIGFVSAFTDAVRYQHTGFVRDATDGVWKLFANVVPEPTTTVDFTDANYGNLLVGNIQATNINTSGNITVSGTGRRFFADMSAAAQSNRFAFQTSTPNNNTNILGIPNGTSVQTTWQAFGNSDPNNSHRIFFGTTTSSDTRIVSDATGTGTIQPMIFIVGTKESLRIGTVGNVTVPGNITVNSDNNTVAIINGGTNGVGNIGASGATFNTVFAKATTAQYADLAEVYTSDQQYPAGTVVIFGGEAEVTQSCNSHDTRIAGVVSTDPAYLMNSTETGVPVALQGRVPCRVLGPVSQGDRVVSSHIPGVAQALDPQQYQPGCIIGKSLQAIDSTDISTIEVVVGRV